jgi:hypothetical protein
MCGYAQCNETLVEDAASKAGSNAIFMREFRVHLNEGTIKNPAPLKKAMVSLHRNVVYRFSIAESKEFKGRMVLQLFNKGQLLGSSFDIIQKQEKDWFDYRCPQNGNYQLLFSFNNGFEGCGAAVMSMVMTDSLSTIDPSVKKIEGSNNVLYLGTDNELGIASDEIQDGHIDVRISQGIIHGQNGKYIARPDKQGKAIVYVNVFDKFNTKKSNDSVVFIVKEIPLPDAEFNGKTGGFMPKTAISELRKLILRYEINVSGSPYEIIGFTIQKSKFDVQSLTSGNAFLTTRQIQFLQTLQSGETFLITHILVKGANNKVYELDPLGFIVD